MRQGVKNQDGRNTYNNWQLLCNSGRSDNYATMCHKLASLTISYTNGNFQNTANPVCSQINGSEKAWVNNSTITV